MRFQVIMSSNVLSIQASRKKKNVKRIPIISILSLEELNMKELESSTDKLINKILEQSKQVSHNKKRIVEYKKVYLD